MTEFNKGALDILSNLLGELNKAGNGQVMSYTYECAEYFAKRDAKNSKPIGN